MQAELDTDLIPRLAAAVAALVRPVIPFEFDLWDVATVAAFLKKSEPYVRERFAPLPDFPKAIRPPNTAGGKSQALYRATEVFAWAMKYQDKH
jgi:hypothetical protein